MTRLQYWTVTLLALASVAAMAANITLSLGNAQTRNDIGQRQQYVQQSVQLEGLYREIVRSLAELAARNNDADVRTMLQRHGITYNVNPPAVATPAPAAAPVRK